MSNFEDDFARGCLPTGEPLECLYGMGWWSEIPEEEPVEPEPKVCEACGGDRMISNMQPKILIWLKQRLSRLLFSLFLKVEGQTEEQYWNLIREYMTDEVQQ